MRDFHEESGLAALATDATERMKPLDVVKILMGIYSERANIKRFMNNSKVWAKYQDYDYEDLYKVASNTVNQFYFDQVVGGPSNSNSNGTKKRKLNE